MSNYQSQAMQSYPIIQNPEVIEASRSMMETTFALAEHAAFTDKLRAALAKQALDNTAMLASAEAQYAQVAPSGQEDYRYIVTTYARSTIARIIGGEWYE